MPIRPLRRRPALLLAALAAAASGLGFTRAEPQAPAEPAHSRSSPAPEQEKDPEALLVLKDGRRITGLLVERAESGVAIRVGGILTHFTNREVESLQVLPPIMERYAELREAVGDDPAQIVRLAEWLNAREKYELAYAEVQRALRIDPANARAKPLKVVLEEQIILRQRGALGTHQPSERRSAGAPRAAEVPLLNPEEINLIKVFEVDLKDAPRLVIPRETVEQMLEKNLGNPLVPITKEGRDAILRRTPAEILDLMFRLRARDFYPRVQVLDQPRSLTAFRDLIGRNWLANSCATTQCHGGAEAGRLMLSARKPGAEPVAYTNFYILTRYHLRDGRSLIDWDNPDRSPLLHLGLPRKDSLSPHPEVLRADGEHDAWKPVFRSTSDRTYQDAAAWIRSMYRPRPDYALTYTPARPFEVAPAASSPPSSPRPESR